MTTFEDRFQRADSTTIGNGWAQYDAGSDTTQILNQYLTTLGPNNTWTSVAQETTVPTDWPQHVRALVAANAAAGQIVTVGCYGRGSGSNLDMGYGVQLEWNNGSNTRTLRIIRGQGSVVVGSYDVLRSTTSLTFIKHEEDNDDFDVYQEIRLVVVPELGGFWVRAYFNEGDDDNPTLEIHDLRDRISYSTRPYGDWYIALKAATSDSLYVGGFLGEDYGWSPIDAAMKRDVLTRAETRDRAKDAYGASNYAISDTVLDRFINDTVAEIVNRLGDDAWWLTPSEDMTLPFDDKGYLTMPAHVRRVLEIYDKDRLRLARWRQAGFAAEGRVTIQMDRQTEDTGRTYRVRYVADWERLAADTDLVPVPRNFAETVVAGAAYRMARYQGKEDRMNQWMREFARLIEQVQMEGGRQRRGMHQAIQVRKRRRPAPGAIRPYDTGY